MSSEAISILFSNYVNKPNTELRETLEYQEIDDRLRRCYEEIIDCLPRDKRSLLMQYEEAQNDLAALEEERAYSTGFTTAMKLTIDSIR